MAEEFVLSRRSWLGRLVRYPGLVLAHRRHGLPWRVCIQLALVILR